MPASRTSSPKTLEARRGSERVAGSEVEMRVPFAAGHEPQHGFLHAGVVEVYGIDPDGARTAVATMLSTILVRRVATD